MRVHEYNQLSERERAAIDEEIAARDRESIERRARTEGATTVIAWLLGIAVLIGFIMACFPARADPCTANLPRTEGTIFTGTVNYIIDGDSICVNNIEVRLANVDAPELGTEYGEGAKRMATAFWLGRVVRCQVVKGRNGRTISFDRVIALCK